MNRWQNGEETALPNDYLMATETLPKHKVNEATLPNGRPKMAPIDRDEWAD